ncbi:MAG: T9SS type A sorting domain-containing protein, partial [Ekhidna sp.]
TPGEDQDGDHEVTITVSDGNATDSETITITVNALPLSVAAVKESIFIYPNPAQDYSKMEVEGEVTYRVFSLNGMSIESASFINETTIDIRELNEGIYFLELSKDGKTALQKFVKVN